MDGARGRSAGSRAKPRAPVSLACSECKARNYKTTKTSGQVVSLMKFCKHCKRHTLHNETK